VAQKSQLSGMQKTVSRQSFSLSPGAVYQEDAVTDCVIIEASIPHFSDRVRVEESYGQIIGGGLQSTTIDEVEERQIIILERLGNA